MAIWCEGCCVDRCDKAVSRFFFALELPWFFEWFLAIPGFVFGPWTWSGITLLPMISVVTIDLASTRPPYLLLVVVTAFATVRSLARFLSTTPPREGPAVGFFEPLSIFSAGNNSLGSGPPPGRAWVVGMFVMQAVPALLFSSGTTKGSWHAGLYTAFCMHVTVPVLDVLKVLVGRRRPVAADSPNPVLKWTRRHVDGGSRQFLSHGLQAFESFPSLNSAIAAVFSGCLWHLTGNPQCFALTAFACIGPIYFWAHHALDVFAGLLIGLGLQHGTTLALGGWQHVGLEHYCGSLAVLYIGLGVARRLPQPAVPDALQPPGTRAKDSV